MSASMKFSYIIVTFMIVNLITMFALPYILKRFTRFRSDNGQCITLNFSGQVAFVMINTLLYAGVIGLEIGSHYV